MHRDPRKHNSSAETEPNLLNYLPKNIWRDVYRGRWGELRPVQKAEFVVEVIFFALFVGGLLNESIRSGHWLSLVLVFGGVWVILGVFFFLLTRFIR